MIQGLAILGSVATAWIVGRTGTAWVRRWASKHLLVAPTSRGMHKTPTPRGGGLVVAVMTALVLLALPLGGTHGWLPSAAQALAVAVVAAVGWLDDVRSLSWRSRLAVHVGAAITACMAWGPLEVSLALGLGAPIAVLDWSMTLVWIVGLVNAYNFMDGIDGIAGAQAVVAGALWSIAGALGGDLAFACVAAVIAAGSLGFLAENWSPAKIFMGDVASTSLGYVFAVLPMIAGAGVEEGGSAWLGLAVVAPFVADASGTLLHRVAKRERITEPHRTHLYQLLALERGHAPVAAGYGALAATTGGAVLAALRGTLPWSVALIVLGALAALIVVLGVARRAHGSK